VARVVGSPGIELTRKGATMKTLIGCIAALVSSAALADDRPVVTAGGGSEPQQRFSALGGSTVGAGANMLQADIGYPGAELSFVHGLRQDLDLGGRISVSGAYEGLMLAPAGGVKGQGLLKLRLLDARPVTLGLELAPGAFVYSTVYGTSGGTALGAAVKLGLAVTDRLGVGITTETPFFFAFAPLRVPSAYPFTARQVVYPAGLYVPLLAGGGVEYAVARNLLLTADAKMGPTLVTATSTAVFTLQAKAGMAWRL
jgi:hypothetical protein